MGGSKIPLKKRETALKHEIAVNYIVNATEPPFGKTTSFLHEGLHQQDCGCRFHKRAYFSKISR